MAVIRVDLNCEELLRKVDNEQDSWGQTPK